MEDIAAVSVIIEKENHEANRSFNEVLSMAVCVDETFSLGTRGRRVVVRGSIDTRSEVVGEPRSGDEYPEYRWHTGYVAVPVDVSNALTEAINAYKRNMNTAPDKERALGKLNKQMRKSGRNIYLRDISFS